MKNEFKKMNIHVSFFVNMLIIHININLKWGINCYMSIQYFTLNSTRESFGERLFFLTKSLDNRPLIILCIGTDRCNGDSLGPLIGYKLNRLNLPNIRVYGTLNNPVHAVNLIDTVTSINQLYNNPFILAIDASLGRKESVGCVTLATGPLIPGLGVGKQLPNVGDIHVTGIVNVKNSQNNLTLQTTRLSMVMDMADFIVEGICHYISYSQAKNKEFLTPFLSAGTIA